MSTFRCPTGSCRWLFAVAACGAACLPARAEAPRVLPPGRLPDDARLGDLRILEPEFPDDRERARDWFRFEPCAAPEAWAARSERLRRQLLVALGLWPMPTKTPPGAVIHGKVDRGEYTVEKVFLESFPGHFVTGSLYRPTSRSGPGPGVLCPHGHWANGRFYDAGEKSLRQQIDAQAEVHESGARYPLQARCVQLARMGCTVFHYDMVGYADSVQISHRPGNRAGMNTRENWGYFSPRAELHLQNMMGLQTYNSIRALDWFADLPDVDPERIAVTGASGGGTQTFLLGAVDRRPAVAFPAVMVSARMQGGCTCENACYLRIGTGNVEIAALIAPRPLGLTCADDWTRKMPTEGFPDLQRHYAMLGRHDGVMLTQLLEFGHNYLRFPHNYNHWSRRAMYDWLDEHLDLGQARPIDERPFEPLSRAEMSVWDDDHPKPPSGDDYERSLLRWITEDSQKQMSRLVPRDAESLARFRAVVGGAVDVMIGRHLADVDAQPVGHKPPDKQPLDDRGKFTLVRRLVSNGAPSEEVPAIVLMPKRWNRRAVIWLGTTGKAALFDEQGTPRPAIERLLGAGAAVVGVDLFGQGEFVADGAPAENTLDPKRGEYAGYTFGYNHPLFSKRVHDVLTVVSALRRPGAFRAEKIDLVGLDGAGHWAAAARAQAGDAIDRAAVDTAGFRFVAVADTAEAEAAFKHPDFLPGAAKYFDLPGMVALSSPGKLWLAGEGPQAPAVVAAAYRAARSGANLTVFDGDEAQKEQAALEWLLQ